MLRCPFNNFSKCDGSCPFSMPDFASCRIADALGEHRHVYMAATVTDCVAIFRPNGKVD